MTLIKDSLAVMAGGVVGMLATQLAVRQGVLDLSANNAKLMGVGLMGYGYSVGMSGNILPSMKLLVASSITAWAVVEIDDAVDAISLPGNPADIATNEDMLQFLGVNAAVSMAIPMVMKSVKIGGL